MGRLMGQDIWGRGGVQEKQELNFQHLDPSNSSSNMALIVCLGKQKKINSEMLEGSC